MDEVPDERTIPLSTVERMVRAVDPTLTVREATPVDRGFCTIQRVVVDDGEGTCERYLKVSPDGNAWGIPTEARIQAVLGARTSIPVPEILGVVDDHESLPTPCYLMSARPGEAVAYERVCRMDDAALRRLATGTGEYLGELHSVPAVDGFGHVRRADAGLSGGRPDGTPNSLTVGDPRADWPTYLRERVTEEFGGHEDDRFADLSAALAEWIEAGIEELEGPFDPVLARNDHGMHNLLVDPDGSITAMLDWGYTLAVPAAVDFEFAVYLYSGAFLAGLPDVADRRSLVREAMLSGYRTTAPERAPAVATPEPRYEALAMGRMMRDFHNLDYPEEAGSAVVGEMRSQVRALLDR